MIILRQAEFGNKANKALLTRKWWQQQGEELAEKTGLSDKRQKRDIRQAREAARDRYRQTNELSGDWVRGSKANTPNYSSNINQRINQRAHATIKEPGGISRMEQYVKGSNEIYREKMQRLAELEKRFPSKAEAVPAPTNKLVPAKPATPKPKEPGMMNKLGQNIKSSWDKMGRTGKAGVVAGAGALAVGGLYLARKAKKKKE